MVLTGRPTQIDADSKSTRLKQWRGYANGTRVPRQTLVKKLDQIERLRGHESRSSAEFNAVLWEVLATEDPAPSVVRGWLARMDKQVIHSVRDAPTITHGRGNCYEIPNLRAIERLRLRNTPSLDSLALLCLVLTQASRFGQTLLAYNCACEAVTTLWQLSRILDRRKVAFALMEYFEERVLPRASLNALQPSMGHDLEKRIFNLAWETQERQRLRPRESDAVASAKIVRHATRLIRGWSALQLQFVAVHKLVPGCDPTARELEQLWWEMGVTELLQMDDAHWSSVMSALLKVCAHLVQVLTAVSRSGITAAAAKSAESETRDDYQAAMRTLQAWCPCSMRAYDRLLELFSQAPTS